MRRLPALLTLGFVFSGGLIAISTAHASTAAFGGTVTEVEDCPSNHKDCLKRFTVRIEHFDYISWGKFNRDSKVGEPITRQVRNVGTACAINGRLVNAATFAAAIGPGHWGYFYEDTWLDLHTTPDFIWGEVVSHDAARGEIALRLHRSHKDYHAEANPPQVTMVKYGDDTNFLVENENATAEEALKPGAWIQVHDPRPSMVEVWTADSAFNPKELLPQAEGRRGYANDLTQAVILGGFETKNPAGVIDQPVTLTGVRKPNGDALSDSINAKSVTFILDGKVSPINIAAQAGRRAILCYYRNQDHPHKVFVQSRDNAVRGRIAKVNDDGQTLAVDIGEGKSANLKINHETIVWLNGKKSTASEALQPGSEAVVRPAQGSTIRAFHAE